MKRHIHCQIVMLDYGEFMQNFHAFNLVNKLLKSFSKRHIEFLNKNIEGRERETNAVASRAKSLYAVSASPRSAGSTSDPTPC